MAVTATRVAGLTLPASTVTAAVAALTLEATSVSTTLGAVTSDVSDFPTFVALLTTSARISTSATASPSSSTSSRRIWTVAGDVAAFAAAVAGFFLLRSATFAAHVSFFTAVVAGRGPALRAVASLMRAVAAFENHQYIALEVRLPSSGTQKGLLSVCEMNEDKQEEIVKTITESRKIVAISPSFHGHLSQRDAAAGRISSSELPTVVTLHTLLGIRFQGIR